MGRRPLIHQLSSLLHLHVNVSQPCRTLIDCLEMENAVDEKRRKLREARRSENDPSTLDTIMRALGCMPEESRNQPKTPVQRLAHLMDIIEHVLVLPHPLPASDRW